MSFLTAVVTSRYPTTNNQLRNSSNPRQQATINNGRVTLQPIQGRQTSLGCGTTRTYTPGAMEKQLWKQRTDILLQLKRGEIYGIPEGQAYRTYALVEVSIDTLTAEHDRYKRTHVLEIRYSNATQLVLEGQNVDLKSKDNNPLFLVEPPKLRHQCLEVPKELPKFSMVNTSLKKLKHYLAGFDVALKKLFKTFNQYFVDELSEVQNVFHQMEQAVEQHRLESKTFEVKMNQVLNENERLLEQVINKDIVNVIMNSSADIASVNVHECEKCLKLKNELQTNFIKKEIYDKLFKSFTTLEKHCISLEVDSQLN
ncbi:hypothetical protein Tco_0180091 [Tanacetum coccineum]